MATALLAASYRRLSTIGAVVIFRDARREDVPVIVALLADDMLGAEREAAADEAYLVAVPRFHRLARGIQASAIAAARPIVRPCMCAFSRVLWRSPPWFCCWPPFPPWVRCGR